MTKLALGSCLWLPRTVGSIAKAWALPPFRPTDPGEIAAGGVQKAGDE